MEEEVLSSYLQRTAFYLILSQKNQINILQLVSSSSASRL
jgi:hypothetical protein